MPLASALAPAAVLRCVKPGCAGSALPAALMGDPLVRGAGRWGVAVAGASGGRVALDAQPETRIVSG